MNIKEEADVGDTLRFESEIEFSLPFSDYQDANPEKTSYEITDFDGDVVAEGELNKNDIGEFFFEWDTEGLSSGDYDVKIEAEQDNSKQIDKFCVRLTCKD